MTLQPDSATKEVTITPIMKYTLRIIKCRIQKTKLLMLSAVGSAKGVEDRHGVSHLCLTVSQSWKKLR